MVRLTSAVVGCGRMGAFTSQAVHDFAPDCWFPLSHIEAMLACESVDLQAACDLDPVTLSRVATRYQSLELFQRYEKMLQEVHPQILSVATRTQERAQIIEAAIQMGVRGFHVEKPLCNSVEQLNQLRDLIDNNGIALSYGAIRRHFQIYKKAKELIESGELGELKEIQVNFGTGQLFWTHPHSVDLILFFAGNREFRGASGHLSDVVFQSKNKIESDPVVDHAILHFHDGVVGTIGRGFGMDIMIHCGKGIVVVGADGSFLSVKRSQTDNPYYEFPGELQSVEKLPLEGTYAAITSLVSQLQEPDYVFEAEYVFDGMSALFLIVQSHMLGGKLVEREDLFEDISILGRTGKLYA
jgi:scyllo-inositol 2-dehydrogenase (NAD+)